MCAGPPLLPRRTALALGAVALASVGCDDGDSPAPGGASSDSAPTDPDVALVEEVVAALVAAEELTRAGGLTELAAMHRAHIEALDGDASTPPGATPATRAEVRAGEERLQRQLVAAAMAARSGALAQLLASMSAAVSQRLAGRLG